MTDDISARPARREDIDGIQSVAREAWKATYDGILADVTIESMITEGYSDDVLERMVSLDEIGLFVAADDREIIGHVSCGMVDTVGLGDLDVYAHPDYWGRGIGEALLDRGIDHLAAIGVNRVQDEVLVENDVGNAFYRKHFDHVGRRSVDFGGKTREVNVYERPVD